MRQTCLEHVVYAAACVSGGSQDGRVRMYSSSSTGQPEVLEHVYRDLEDVDSRIHRYATCVDSVRRRVRGELRFRVELHQPGSISPALVALVAVASTSAGLILSFWLSLVGYAVAAAVPLQNPKTGAVPAWVLRGLNQVSAGVPQAFVIVPAVVLAVAVFVVWHAKRQDRQRAVYKYWLDAYEADEVDRETRATRRQRRGLRQSMPRRRRLMTR